MILSNLICFICSSAVASLKETAILYNRSAFISLLFSLYLSYSVFNFYNYENSASLFNGLMYINLTTIVFAFFIQLLAFFILILTSSYPYQSNLGFVSAKTLNIFGSISNLAPLGAPQSRVVDGTEKDDLTLIEDTYENSKKSKSYFTEKTLLQVDREHYKIIEYPLIIQFILVGSIVLLSSSDLVTMFLAIELQSYGLYIISTIYRNSESSTSAGITYFLLGGLSSCIILLGQSFIYINTGTTNLDNIYLIHNIITCDENLLMYYNISNDMINSNHLLTPIFTLNFYQSTLQLSLIILSVGFFFKISAAPFHSWSPGVYDAIPTVTTTFVAIIPKISIFILLFDLLYYTWYTTLEYTWSNVFLFSSFLSLIIGSVLGLTQFRIKRLYAYSTISHVGFLLLGISIHSVESIQAFFFYLIQYSLSNLNAFLILVAIGYIYVNLEKKTSDLKYKNVYNSTYYKEYYEKIKDLSPIIAIDQLKGFFYINPVLAMSLSITLFSFIGVPPLVGFFAKQMVLSSALDNGAVFMCLIAILTSVISAVYYLYIVKDMFFEKSKYIWNQHVMTPHSNYEMGGLHVMLSCWLSSIISILSLIMLLFIFLYYEIYSLVNILSIQIVY